MRLTIWERIEILFIQRILIPIFCIWLGRYFNKIIVKGDYGRKSIYYEKYKMKSPIDSVIVDMILDHFNRQSLEKKPETLSGQEFTDICLSAEEIYYEEILIETQMARA